MELKDYIFVTGASGIGKTTLANGLLAHYKTTCIEQNMIPEFISRDGIELMIGELEELIDPPSNKAEGIKNCENSVF